MSIFGKKVNWLLILTSLGFFMAMMDAMIVTTASTAIRLDFQVSVATLQWALNAYNITIAAVLLVGVSLGERWGRRKVYNWGILIFTVGSVLCALAPTMPALIAARVVEGVGASVMTPMSMAILTQALSANERGRALGIWSGIGGLALIVGPSLGGFIVAKLAWQWIFWINVPIGLVAIGLSRRYLPESVGQTDRLKLLDAFLIIVTFTGIILGLSLSTHLATPMLAQTALVSGVAGLVAGGWLLWRQAHATQPVIPLTLFKSVTFTGGNLATALTAGLKLLPWTGTLVLVAPFAGRAVDRWGEKWVATLGLFLQGFGYGLIAILVQQQKTYSWLVLPLMLAGMGLSMAGPALQKAVLGAVPAIEIGKASGIYNVFRLFGGALGTAITVMIFEKFSGGATNLQFMTGFQMALLGTAVISWLGLCWSLRLR